VQKQEMTKGVGDWLQNRNKAIWFSKLGKLASPRGRAAVPGKHYAGEASGGIEITKFILILIRLLFMVPVVGTTVLYDSSYTTTTAVAVVLLLLVVVGRAKQR